MLDMVEQTLDFSLGSTSWRSIWSHTKLNREYKILWCIISILIAHLDSLRVEWQDRHLRCHLVGYCTKIKLRPVEV